MKKIVFVLVLLSLTVLFASCSNELKPQIDITDKFYYLSVYVENEYGGTNLLHRFNVENGRMTPLCSDPLCDHSSEAGCAFNGLINYTVEDDIIWFDRNGEGEDDIDSYICRYDIANGTLDIMETYKTSGYTNVFKYGHLWRYFTHSNPTEKDISIRVSLSECNFNDPEEIDADKIPFAQNGDLYYYADFGKFHSPATSIYAAYTDFSDEWLVADGIFATDFRYWNGFIYYLEKENLWRVSVDEEISGQPTNTKEMLKERISGYFFHGDKLFYLQKEEEPDMIGWDEYLEEDVENTYGGKIWRANPDGTKAKVYIEIDDYVISKSQLYNAQVGSKIVLRFGKWIEREKSGEILMNWRAADGGLIVIDLAEGGYTAYEDLWETNR